MEKGRLLNLKIWIGLNALMTTGSFLAAPAAFAESVLTADGSLAINSATNPRLENGSVKPAASASVTLVPKLVITDPLTTYQLRADVRVEEYSRRYPTYYSYGVDGNLEHKISDSAELSANIGFRSSIVGANEAFFNSPGPLVENEPSPIFDDIAINEFNQRRNTLRADIGGVKTLSAYDSVNLGISATANRFGGTTNLNEYNYVTQNIGYARQLTSQTSVTAGLGFSQIAYLKQKSGDGSIVSPSLGATFRASENFTLDVSAGISLANLKTGSGRSKSTSWQASVDACHKSARDSFCLGANRQTLPSALGGIRTQSAISLGYDRRINRDDDFNLSAGFARSSGALLGSDASYKYVSAATTYSHRFKPALSGFVSAGYSRSYQAAVDRKANVQVGLGIRISFGRRG